MTQPDLPPPAARGKVRDLYDLGDRLMIVASDRISAFDVVMAEPVPGKGVLLTQLSEFWLRSLSACSPHHLDYVVSAQRVPPGWERYTPLLAGRAMVVQKAWVLPIECVVRGYLAGGGWKEYQASGSVSGVQLPDGLKLAERLRQPIFTPSTKAAAGHDEPVSFDKAIDHVAAQAASAREVIEQRAGLAARPPANSERLRSWADDLMQLARRRSLEIYEQAAAHAAECGLILADTKFEFGISERGLILIDEVLTPDSSRYWDAAAWRTGHNPPSFDKQFLRDYLETLDWAKRPPPPKLPDEIISQTRKRYAEVFERLAAANPKAFMWGASLMHHG